MTRDIGLQLLGKQGMFLVVAAAVGVLVVGQTDLPSQVCFIMGLLTGVSMLFFFKANDPASSNLSGAVTESRQEVSPAAEPTSSGQVILYVGNIAYQSKEADLFDLFASHGKVKSVRILTDRATHRSRGFGFVEMDASDANAAIAALDGFEFNGRSLRVTPANDR